jgi:hypothetical protein
MAIPRSMIILQENTGNTPLDDGIEEPLRGMIRGVIDALSETFEDIKNSLLNLGRYDQVHLLTDNRCKPIELVNALVEETKQGRAIDLVILGHGSEGSLLLKNSALNKQDIRNLMRDAQIEGVDAINLRMVYMCNCYGRTVIEDWLAIGAKVAIGPSRVNYMPEPTTTFFLNNWFGGMTASDAAHDAYERALIFFPFLSRDDKRGSEFNVGGKTDECAYDTIPVQFAIPRLDIPPADGSENPVDTKIFGITPLKAYAPGASVVTFSAYYATDPNNVDTVDWHTIGQGDSEGHSVWKLNWDTTNIPNQGNSGWGTVNLKAGATEDSDEISAYRRVDLNNNLSVRITNPSNGQLIHGRVKLKAVAPEDSSVIFSAYYATNPHDERTLDWRTLGKGKKDHEGIWTYTWNTRNIPDQINIDWDTVNICAYLDYAYGHVSSPRDYCKVCLNNKSIKFLQPLRNSIVTGVIRLNVHALGAKKVVFTGYKYTNDGLSIEKIYQIGDASPAGSDEWKIDWDTRECDNGRLTLGAQVHEGYGIGNTPLTFCKVTILN